MSLGYSAVALGERDFLTGAAFLHDVGDRLNVPFVASNIEPEGGGRRLGERTRIVEARAGRRIVRVGIFSVANDQPSFWEFQSDVRPGNAREAARAAIAELRGRVDVIVCVAHMTRLQAHQLVENAPGADLVLLGHQPSANRETDVIGRTVIVDGAPQGKQIRVVEWEVAPKGKQGGGCRQSFFAPLGDDVPDDEEIAALVREYEGKMAGHGASGPEEVAFVGSESCEQCHADAFYVWQESGHAGAFVTLEESGLAAPECLACHTTGYRHPGGFVNEEAFPELASVGCEACHGPGEKHIMARAPAVSQLRSGGTPVSPEQGRLQVPKSEECVTCHDATNDPDFDVSAAMTKIAHGRGAAR